VRWLGRSGEPGWIRLVCSVSDSFTPKHDFHLSLTLDQFHAHVFFKTLLYFSRTEGGVVWPFGCPTALELILSCLISHVASTLQHRRSTPDISLPSLVLTTHHPKRRPRIMVLVWLLSIRTLGTLALVLSTANIIVLLLTPYMQLLVDVTSCESASVVQVLTTHHGSRGQLPRSIDVLSHSSIVAPS
jgi:hypothetical protein